MIKFFEKKSNLLITIIDITIICLAYGICLFLYAYLYLEYEFSLLAQYSSYLLFFIFPYVVLLNFLGFFRNLWQFMNISDMFLLILSLGSASIIFVTLSFVFTPKPWILVLTLLTALVSTNLIIISRFLIILVYQKRHRKQKLLNANRLAIVGAGQVGSWILDSLDIHKDCNYVPVCFFDDNPGKVGKSIKGVKIVGTIDEIEHYCQKLGINDIIIAIPSATREQKRRILDRCANAGCRVITAPSIDEYITLDKSNIINNLRKISVEDLLERDPVVLDTAKVKDNVAGKTVLVTGGGGSIGSELCRQVARYNPAKLIILDIYENSAYEIQQELLAAKHDFEIVVEIASIRDAKKMDAIFAKYRPDIVYHAAAHKHVPLMENNPDEAVKNNIFGTYNVITAADRHKCGQFVLISSDKAVNPTNVMGATKRFCEMMIQAMKGRSKTKFLAVRFGNVLGSNGSVIPLFKKQIENGGPVSVTHPDIIRYFMTIPEAVSLVMLAGTETESGSVYVLDMGVAVKIDDLARKMISLSGYVPDKNIKIEYTGLRPGEKMYEELLLNTDHAHKTANDKIYIEELDDINWSDILEYLDNFKDILENGNSEEISEYIMKVIKEDRGQKSAAQKSADNKAPEKKISEIIIEKLTDTQTKKGAVV